jgi:hypothetical protein
MAQCQRCDGYGSSLQEDAEQCTACGGTGLVRKESRMFRSGDRVRVLNSLPVKRNLWGKTGIIQQVRGREYTVAFDFQNPGDIAYTIRDIDLVRAEDANERLDQFLTQTHCDRCNTSLEGKARILSWFNKQTICMECSVREREIRAKLPEGGATFEGCGFIPEVPAKPVEPTKKEGQVLVTSSDMTTLEGRKILLKRRETNE